MYFLLTGRPTAHCVTSKEQLKFPFDVNPNVRKPSNAITKGHDARELIEASVVSKDHSAKFKKIKKLNSNVMGMLY